MPVLSPLSLVLRCLVLVCLIGSGLCTAAQQREDDLVYKFKLQGIDDPVAAKAVQAVVLQEPEVFSCSFIDEADQFKLATGLVLSYAGLKSLLGEQGSLLVGAVLVSDGSVLIQPNAPKDDQ
ncbi:MAG: hypothetical protein ABI599_02250 [Flavobacteriales bacterium]